MFKGFLNHMGIPFNTKFKRPKLLPQRVRHKDLEKLKETIRNKRTHKKSAFRDLVLIETAVKTGMRRGERELGTPPAGGRPSIWQGLQR